MAGLILGLLVPLFVQAQPAELSLGSALPQINATLTQVDGSTVSLQRLLGETGTVFIFWSNTCPWVDRYEDRIQTLIQDFQPSTVQFVLVNANDATAAPEESLDASRERAQSRGYRATYVRDAKAALARALGASRTPHAFVFDRQETLVYAGAIDDSPSDSTRVEESYLRDAIGAVEAGEEPEGADTNAFGCTLKYPN